MTILTAVEMGGGGVVVKNGSETSQEAAARVLRDTVMAMEMGEVDRVKHPCGGRSPELDGLRM